MFFFVASSSSSRCVLRFLLSQTPFFTIPMPNTEYSVKISTIEIHVNISIRPNCFRLVFLEFFVFFFWLLFFLFCSLLLSFSFEFPNGKILKTKYTCSEPNQTKYAWKTKNEHHKIETALCGFLGWNATNELFCCLYYCSALFTVVCVVKSNSVQAK